MRSLEQNAIFQKACRDLCEHFRWPTNGHFVHLNQDEMRWLLCADILGQKSVRGVHGGVVMLGGSSRKLTKDDCSQAIMLAFSIGDAPWEYGLDQPRIEWSDSINRARGRSPNDDDMAEQYGDR